MFRIINRFLKLFNLKIARANQHANGLSYISAKDTVANAKAENLSVCDYVEREWNQIGETQKVIDKMKDFGFFELNSPSICEIGAGTGRYMEKVLDNCNPSRYESYETASDWAEWLQNEYPIISQPTNGFSLNSTADSSLDLIHSHGVFVYLKFLDNIRYFNDMIRTLKPNGKIVFDCYTEDCMEDDVLDKWLTSIHNFPSIMPNDYVEEYFVNRGLKLMGTFFNAHGQGKSKYFVFKKLTQLKYPHSAFYL